MKKCTRCLATEEFMYPGPHDADDCELFCAKCAEHLYDAVIEIKEREINELYKRMMSLGIAIPY